MLSIKRFTFNHFATNCYVIYSEESKLCAIVDPTAETPQEESRLDEFIVRNDLTPRFVLLTHAHVDHLSGLKNVCDQYRLPVTMHRDGDLLLSQASDYGLMMGFAVSGLSELSVNYIESKEQLAIGDDSVECRFVPGHCPGSMCYVLHRERQVITGDALFRLSIGRTDLPGGDYDLLMRKLKEEVLSLDDDFQVLPGHGDDSTIGYELKCNGFLL